MILSRMIVSRRFQLIRRRLKLLLLLLYVAQPQPTADATTDAAFDEKLLTSKPISLAVAAASSTSSVSAAVAAAKTITIHHAVKEMEICTDDWEEQQRKIALGGNSYPDSNDPCLLQPASTRQVDYGRTRAIGWGLSMPKGSPWCKSRPTYWVTGHERPEHPYCYDATADTWNNDSNVVLDVYDELNSKDLTHGIPKPIDRHDCTSLDANNDGIPDIICSVGADKRQGYGYNELYLSQPDGSIKKVKEHGLQKYPTLSTRVVAKLKHGPTNRDLIFVGVASGVRDDLQVNSNRMFITTVSNDSPYFQEYQSDGSWTETSGVSVVEVADVNGDGYEDFFLVLREKLRLFVQNNDGRFVEERLRTARYGAGTKLRDVKYGVVGQNDDIPDLITVEGYESGEYYLKIYCGIRGPPYMDFETPCYVLELPRSPRGVEILDVNGDGIPDIYVTQSNEDGQDQYCALKRTDLNDFWWQDYPVNSTIGPPPPDWLPPIDAAFDFLLVGGSSTATKNSNGSHLAFRIIKMNFRGRGCGSWVKRFGSKQSLMVPRARARHAGYNYLYSWKAPPTPVPPIPVPPIPVPPTPAPPIPTPPPTTSDKKEKRLKRKRAAAKKRKKEKRIKAKRKRPKKNKKRKNTMTKRRNTMTNKNRKRKNTTKNKRRNKRQRANNP